MLSPHLVFTIIVGTTMSLIARNREKRDAPPIPAEPPEPAPSEPLRLVWSSEWQEDGDGRDE
jgi:hypothetical protein